MNNKREFSKQNSYETCVIDADLHIHSKYSKDSFLNPKSIVKTAIKRGLSAIAICDHETFKGVKETTKLSKGYSNLYVIAGVEIKTNIGDIIGLFTEETMIKKDVYDVIDEIKGQNGLVVLPHPTRGHKICYSILNKVDLIEGLNGRCSPAENADARYLAKKFNKPIIAGSDAHFSFEIGRVRTRFLGNITDPDDLKEMVKNYTREIIGSESPLFVHLLSFGVEKLKILTSI